MGPLGSQLRSPTHATLKFEEKCPPNAPLTTQNSLIPVQCPTNPHPLVMLHSRHRSSLHQTITLQRPFGRFYSHCTRAIEAVQSNSPPNSIDPTGALLATGGYVLDS